MDIGIGLPSTIPGAQGDFVLEWARRAEAGPFASLGLVDRLVYTNYEPLITIAAAAAVTRRVRLMTTILVAPLHSAAILAKQAATIDALSQGRLSLGVAVGTREDDYQAAGVSYHERGKIFDEQLATMKRLWAGEALSAEVGPIGPHPVRQGGPELLIGGNTPTALQRVGRWGDGLIVGGGGAKGAQQSYQLAEQSWKDAGRPGKPRFVCCMYYGLGAQAKERAGTYIHDYYSFMTRIADSISETLASTPDAIKSSLHAFQEAGADEVILWPTIADWEQLDGLAEIVSTLS